MQTPDRQHSMLHVLTFEQPEPEPPSCEGGYLCLCPQCEHERQARLRRGVRRNPSHPAKRPQAA